MSPTPSIPDALREAVEGDYEILSELGQGGMAAVFLARDLTLGRKVAIKVMAPQLMAVPGMAERFLQEARIAAALSHPHIIPIHAVRRRGDLLYIVMRFVAGRSLDRILAESGPLPAETVRAILTQVGGALEAAHRAGVIHRDIKPANILIDEQGDAVVADFGIARLGEQPGTTQAGQTVGTPEYMSPEQCSGGALTGAADQYSLGVVAYELLTGAPPFTGEGLVQIVWKMINESPAPLTSRVPGCDPVVAGTVHRMLARDAGERWPSVADAVAALPAVTFAADSPARRALAARARGEGAAPARLSSAATVVAGVSGPSQAMPTAAGSGATAAITPLDSSPALPVATAASIRLPLPACVVTIGDEIPLRAELLDEAGARIAAPLAWESSDDGIAHVDATGVLHPHRIGQVTLTARSGDAWTSMTVVVTRSGVRALTLSPRKDAIEVGDRIHLKLATGEPDGLLPHPRLAHWNSSDRAVIAVDPVGRITARAEGRAEISAKVGGVSTSLPFRVTKAMVSAVRVSAPMPRVTIGQPVRLAAEPENTNGHPLDGMPVRWEVSDPAVAAISPDGVLVPLRHGQVLVAARVGGRVGTTRVTVAAG